MFYFWIIHDKVYFYYFQMALDGKTIIKEEITDKDAYEAAASNNSSRRNKGEFTKYLIFLCSNGKNGYRQFSTKKFSFSSAIANLVCLIWVITQGNSDLLLSGQFHDSINQGWAKFEKKRPKIQAPKWQCSYLWPTDSSTWLFNFVHKIKILQGFEKIRISRKMFGSWQEIVLKKALEFVENGW